MLEEMDLRSSNKFRPKLKRIMAFARSKELPSTFFVVVERQFSQIELMGRS
jgi:hypothetical protein